MIITTCRTQRVGGIESTESAAVQVQPGESVETALKVLWRIREKWDAVSDENLMFGIHQEKQE